MQLIYYVKNELFVSIKSSIQHCFMPTNVFYSTKACNLFDKWIITFHQSGWIIAKCELI